jgi:hypothetical protein
MTVISVRFGELSRHELHKMPLSTVEEHSCKTTKQLIWKNSTRKGNTGPLCTAKDGLTTLYLPTSEIVSFAPRRADLRLRHSLRLLGTNATSTDIGSKDTCRQLLAFVNYWGNSRCRSPGRAINHANPSLDHWIQGCKPDVDHGSSSRFRSFLFLPTAYHSLLGTARLVKHVRS